jgi:translation initiation factor 3 subunit I
MKSHDFKIYCIGLSRDGNKFVTGSADRTAKIWDTNTGQLLFTLQKHDLPV